MRVTVGSKNQTKIEAVREALEESSLFKDAEIIPMEVAVEQFGHPITLPMVVEGAIDRARQAFQNCAYSFGIEGGLIEVPQTKSGYMETSVCAIYDGNQFHLGMAPAYEWPKAVIDLIMKKGLDGSQAFREAGLTEHEKIGTAGGGVAILTKGRMDRKGLNKLAVMMALIHLENEEHYTSAVQT